MERSRKLECDLVALTGDFVHAGFRHIQGVADILGRLNAPLGVFAVLGNHDHAVRIFQGVRQHRNLAAAVSQALSERGIQVLTNRHCIVQKGGAALAVVGVDDLWSKSADLPAALRGVPDDVPRIVLAHNPATIVQAEGHRCDLMLSGHTHGGQIRVPSWAPGARVPQAARFAAGLYFHDTGYLYVHKGVGYTFRFRYKVRPEIAVLRLRSQASAAPEARPSHWPRAAFNPE